VTPQTTGGQADLLGFDYNATAKKEVAPTPTNPPAQSQSDKNDFMDIFNSPAPTTSNPTTQPTPATNVNIFDLYANATPQSNSMYPNNMMGQQGMMPNMGGTNLMGMNMNPGGMGMNLGGIFGVGGMGVNPIVQTQQPVINNSATDLLGGLNFGSTSTQSTANSGSSTNSLTLKAFSDDNLEIMLSCSKESPDTASILTNFSNKSGFNLTDLVFQAAVQKHLKLSMNAISSNKIPPNTQNGVTQTMKVSNTMQGQKGIVLKLKISYNLNGQTVTKDQLVNDFPATY